MSNRTYHLNGAEIRRQCDLFLLKRGLSTDCDIPAFPLESSNITPTTIRNNYMKSDPSFAPRLMRTEQASTYVGGTRILDLFCLAGWAKPAVQENRFHLWDRLDLDSACDLLKRQGYATLQKDVKTAHTPQPQS